MRQITNSPFSTTQQEIGISKDSPQRILLYEHRKHWDSRTRRCGKDQPN